MPKKTTKKTNTKKAAKAPPKERSGLRPQTPLGRALLAVVHLFLDDFELPDEPADGEDPRGARKNALVQGFLERDYGVQWSSLHNLERDIASLLLSTHAQQGDVEPAMREARQLASALVEKVFELRHQRLKELVPDAVAAVELERKAEENAKVAAQRQREAMKAKGKAPAGGKKAPKGKAPAGGKKAPKGKAPAGGKKAPKGRGKGWDRGLASRLPSGLKKDSKRRSLASPVEPAAARGDGLDTGVGDPLYGQALLQLRELGNHVDEGYAVDDLADTLGIPVDRAEAILAAAKAAGDWGAKASSNGKAPADETSSAAGPRDGAARPTIGHLAELDAAQRFVDEQRRQGRKPSANGLKKALGIGHARAAKLLEQVLGGM